MPSGTAGVRHALLPSLLTTCASSCALLQSCCHTYIDLSWMKTSPRHNSFVSCQDGTAMGIDGAGRCCAYSVVRQACTEAHLLQFARLLGEQPPACRCAFHLLLTAICFGQSKGITLQRID